MKFMKKRQFRPFRMISYDFVRFFHEFSWKWGRFGRFVWFFHENSWRWGRFGRFVRFRMIFSWKKGQNIYFGHCVYFFLFIINDFIIKFFLKKFIIVIFFLIIILWSPNRRKYDQQNQFSCNFLFFFSWWLNLTSNKSGTGNSNLRFHSNDSKDAI